jgi:hypothetical protein
MTSPQELIDIVKAHNLKTRQKIWTGSTRSMNSLIEYALKRTSPQRLTISITKLAETLVSALSVKEVRLEFAKVGQVSIWEKEVILYPNESPEYPHYMKYDYLINTIPLKTFTSLCKIPDADMHIFAAAYEAMLYSPIFSGLISEERVTPNLQRFDFVYSPFQNGWYRMSKSAFDGAFCVEFADEISAKAFDCHELQTLNYGHIYSDNPGPIGPFLTNLHKKHILCIGRFGKWESGSLVYQTAKEAQQVAQWIQQKID